MTTQQLREEVAALVGRTSYQEVTNALAMVAWVEHQAMPPQTKTKEQAIRRAELLSLAISAGNVAGGTRI